MYRQIIAAGGDVLSDVALHYYIMAQSKPKPNICLLPTASGDNAGLITHFMKQFERYNCKPDYLPLFHNKEKNIREFILKQDIILVTGGHSFSQMAVWKAWGVDKFLKEAYNNGTILSGGSAGSVCWFNECITDSFGDTLSPMKCLDFLPYSHCPHYRSNLRRNSYKSAILSRQIQPGYAVNDGAAIHFKNEQFYRAVHSIENMSSFFVEIDTSGKNEKIKSTRLDSHYLMDESIQNNLIWNTPAFL